MPPLARWSLMLAVIAFSPSALADDERARARADFEQGTALVRQTRWAEALDAFERAAAKSPHPIATYNIGACERALGRYTRARETLRRALAEHAAAGADGLPSSHIAEAHVLLGEIDRLLARIRLRVRPAEARVTIDGRPIRLGSSGEYDAGTLPPGKGEIVHDPQITIVVDPGTHVLLVERDGYSSHLVRPTLAPGGVEEIPVDLAVLPATLDISSSVEDALVEIDSTATGTTPVRLTRPPGPHHITVRKSGFATYDAMVTLKPGEETKLRATLAVERVPLTSRWWFWTAASAVLAGAAVGTYFAVRETPSPDPPTGGSMGWNVTLP